MLEVFGRRRWTGVSALLAVAAVWLAVGAARADAAVSLTPSTVGAGTITTAGGTTSPAYDGCNQTGNQNDSVVASCGTSVIPTGLVSQCFPFIGCITLPGTTTLLLAATPSPTPSGHWRFVRWEGCAAVTGNVCTIVNPNAGASAAPRAVFDDFVAPTVSSLSTIHSTTTDRGVSFGSVAGNETLSAPECRVDGGAFAPCDSVRQFSEGTHTVQARAKDLSGNLSSISGNLATFRIIDTNLVSGPAQSSFSSNKRPTFTYSTIAGINFQCSIDNVSVTTPCGTKDGSGRASFTPPANLTEGVHTFRVRALDGPDFDRVPITRTWTVDSVAPTTTLASPTITDGIVTTLLNARFTFGHSEAAGSFDRFECKLDSAGFAPCTSPKEFDNLGFGQHEFSVRGIDKAGNVGAVQKRTWTVAARDNDGDGFDQRSDCNDGSPAINPVAFDIPDNGVDENCDRVDAINLDRDGDGFQRPGDCDDGNAAIKPGTPDLPDNGVDENCDGSDAKTPPLPQNSASLTYNYAAPTKKSTRFTLFQVKTVPAGSKIAISCKKCPKKARKITKTNAKGTVAIKQLKAVLKAGTKIVVTVTKPGTIGVVKTVSVRSLKAPVVAAKCLPPGSSKPVSCAG